MYWTRGAPPFAGQPLSLLEFGLSTENLCGAISRLAASLCSAHHATDRLLYVPAVEISEQEEIVQSLR